MCEAMGPGARQSRREIDIGSHLSCRTEAPADRHAQSRGMSSAATNSRTAAPLALTTQEGPVSRQIVKEPRRLCRGHSRPPASTCPFRHRFQPLRRGRRSFAALSIVAGPRQPPAIKTSQHMTATSNLTLLYQCHVAALSVSRPDTRYYLQMPYHKHPSNRKENRCPCGAVYCLAVSPAYSATILSAW